MSDFLQSFRSDRFSLHHSVRIFRRGAVTSASLLFLMFCVFITSAAVAAPGECVGWRALVMAKKAVARAERRADPDSIDLALSLNNLAGCYYFRAQYAAAEPLFRRALAIREKSLGLAHPDVATSLNNLAELYNTQGRYADAGPLYRRTLVIREEAFGPDHPYVVSSLNNIARLYAL
jgi:tetratricopeptide (TPR) repeat protein